MFYSFSFSTVALWVGILLLLTHLAAWLHGPALRVPLARFPRSRVMGVLLFTIAAVWGFYLVATMDLGEFGGQRTLFLWIIAIAYGLAIFFVEEFLAVRALGMILLLAAQILLDAAFMKESPWRLSLTILAYVWVIAGCFWIGMPYLLRDQIAWLGRSPLRWKIAAGAGFLYGVGLVVIAVAPNLG